MGALASATDFHWSCPRLSIGAVKANSVGETSRRAAEVLLPHGVAENHFYALTGIHRVSWAVAAELATLYYVPDIARFICSGVISSEPHVRQLGP